MRFSIGSVEFGEGCPVRIIAEGCDNHLGNLQTAKEMSLRAKLAGADIIKFQHHLPDEEMLPEVPTTANFNMPLYEFLKRYALTLSQHVELMKYCDSIGIQYLCTPFSYKAAVELKEIGVKGFKIGSGEMTDTPSLERIAKLGLPMIVSTGMCEMPEIDRTYNLLTGLNVPLMLMNCISEYPPQYEDVNLGVIPVMQKRYEKALVGHSDHTPDNYTSFAAVALGAYAIEKHVILDKRQPGPDQSVSIDFNELAALVDGSRKIYASLGAEKRIHSREAGIREWAFRSIVSVRELKAGEVIADDMIWSKRPGTGIPSHKRAEVLGKKLKSNVPANTLLKWSDLE
jgi:sialic acid synthase SpsE